LDIARNASRVATTRPIEKIVVTDAQKRLGRPAMVIITTAAV
jgi:hypothetical protein